MNKKEILQKLVDRIDWPTIYEASESITQRTKQAEDIDFTYDDEEEIFENLLDSLSAIREFLYEIDSASQQFDYYYSRVSELEEANEDEFDEYWI